MYEQPELKEYQDEWIQAERDLAINSLGILGLFPIVQEEFTPSESSGESIKRSKTTSQKVISSRH